MTSKPIYSICMCNYNMADTLERSLRSLFSQLDDRFELVVVDDGSSDDSLDVLRKLQQEHAIKVISLKRDSKRKLGATRNISVQEASGTYILLHLDCDDTFGPYVADFTQIFHCLEKISARNILVSGAHINMARRDFLLEHGGYINIFRGEDRELWSRMAAIHAWIPLDHIDFITRLPKRKEIRIERVVFHTLNHMSNVFRLGESFARCALGVLQTQPILSGPQFLLRLVALIPAKFHALCSGPLPTLGPRLGVDDMAVYKAQHCGTFSEIMERHGTSGDLSFLREEARHIFASGQKLWG